MIAHSLFDPVRLLAAASLLLAACATSSAQDQQENPLLLGEFAVTRVVDGDTIAVDGLEGTIRFLGIDTEECEKGPGAEERTQRIAADFAAIARAAVREDPMAKFSTPMGWQAKKFAEQWFPIGSRVRVEHDLATRTTGYYGRALGYVFVQRGGRWVNYNVECVRAGMSPYFDKYGRSERFEHEFLAAEREARTHRRGIWSPYSMSYPNYDERMVIWARRSRTLTAFRAQYLDHLEAVILLDEADWARLPSLTDYEVLLCGTVDARRSDARILELHHKEFERVALVFADQALFDAVCAFVDEHAGDLLQFRGKLAPGFERGDVTYRYQIAVTEPHQVFLELPGDLQGRRFPAAELEVAATGDRIAWQHAGRHTGEQVAVVGRVVRTNNIGDIAFLNFARDWRDTLSIVIRKESFANFPEPPEVTYKDRVVLVRGTVTLHKGAPQIVITGPDQIEIIE